jgi:hypothetical protein
MDAKPRFSVLLDDPTVLAVSLPLIARVVAQVLGEHPTDVVQKVRYGGGIVARDVSGAAAREVARGLAQAGLGSFLVETAAFVAAPRPRRIGHLELGPAGLQLAQRLRAPEAVPWAAVLGLHAHASFDVTSEDEEGPARRGGDVHLLSEGARRLLGALREVEDRERSRVVLGLDLLVAHPDGPLLYRATSNDPGIYHSLPARAPIALENYLALLRLLVTTAPAGVLVPPSTRRFCEDLDFTRVLYGKREELEAFNAWMIQAHDHGIALADRADPEDLGDEGLEDADEAIPVAAGGGGPGDEDADEIDDDELVDSTPPVSIPRARLAQAASARAREDDAPLDHSAYELDPDDVDDVDDADEPGDEAAAGDDPELAETVKLFDKTGRLGAEDVQKILAEAGAIDAGEVEAPPSADPDADPEVKETLGFFETAASGRWAVEEVLEGAEDVGADELEAGDA